MDFNTPEILWMCVCVLCVYDFLMIFPRSFLGKISNNTLKDMVFFKCQKKRIEVFP